MATSTQRCACCLPLTNQCATCLEYNTCVARWCCWSGESRWDGMQSATVKFAGLETSDSELSSPDGRMDEEPNEIGTSEDDELRMASTPPERAEVTDAPPTSVIVGAKEIVQAQTSPFAPGEFEQLLIAFGRSSKALLLCVASHGHLLVEGEAAFAADLISTIPQFLDLKVFWTSIGEDTTPADIAATVEGQIRRRLKNVSSNVGGNWFSGISRQPNVSLLELISGAVGGSHSILVVSGLQASSPQTEELLTELLMISPLDRLQRSSDGSLGRETPGVTVVATAPIVDAIPLRLRDRFRLHVLLDSNSTIPYGSLPVSLRRPIASSRTSSSELSGPLGGNVPPVVCRAGIVRLSVANESVFVHNELEQLMRDQISALRIHPLVYRGVSPLASISLGRCARVLACLCGRSFVEPTHISSLAVDLLAHRITLTSGETRSARDVTNDVLHKLHAVV